MATKQKPTPKDNFVTTLLNSLSQGAQQNIVDPAKQFAQQVTPTITNAANMVGKTIGEQPILNATLPGQQVPTLADTSKVLGQGKPTALSDVLTGNVQNVPKTLGEQNKRTVQALTSPDINEALPIAIGTLGESSPQNGGKYINEAPATFSGGTAAKIKAGTTQPIKFKYIPPEISTEAQPVQKASSLPPIGATTAETPIGQKPPGVVPPEAPVQPGLSPRENFIQKANGLANYQLPATYGEYRVPLENQDKSVMQKVIGGNTAGQVLDRAIKAKNDIWNQVEQKAGEHSAIDSNTQVLPYIKAKLDDLVSQGLIDQSHANAAIIGETKNLTQNGADIEGNATLTGNQLVDLRKGANSVAPTKIPYGSTNPIPYVRKAISEGYSDAMGSLDPTINNLYQQYSSVKRIGQMPDSFRNQSLTMGKIPGTDIGIPFSGSGRRYLAALASGNKAAIAPLAVGATVVAGTQLPKITDTIANSLGYVKKQSYEGTPNNEQGHADNIQPNNQDNYINHDQTIPQYTSDVNTNKAIADPSQIADIKGNPLLLDTGTYNSKLQELNDKKSSFAQGISLGLPNARAESSKIDNQLKVLNDKYQTTQTLIKTAADTKTKLGYLNDAKSLIQNAPPSWLQAMGGKGNWFTRMETSFDPAFAAWRSQVSSLAQQSPDDMSGILTAGSADVANKVIDQAIKRTAQNYVNVIKTNGGAGIVKSGIKAQNGEQATEAQKVATPQVGATGTVNQAAGNIGNATGQTQPAIGTPWAAMASTY